MDKTDRKRLNIAMALNDLMETRPIEQISIVELCQEAGISRSTFYVYFEDIYTVGEWLWEREFRTIFEGLGREYGYHECFRRLFERLRQLGPRLAHVRPMRPHGAEKAQGDKTYAHMNSLAEELRATQEALGRPLCDEERRHIEYISCAEEAMTLKWFAEGMSVPPEVMADYFVQAAPEFVLQAVGR